MNNPRVFTQQSVRLLSSKLKFVFVLTLALLALSGAAAATFAQAPGGEIKTDLDLHAPTGVPALPAAGGKLHDPVFGTEIMRVTDERDGANGAGTSYSYWPTFNADNTRVLVMGAGGEAGVVIYDFDPVTFRLGAKQTLPLLNGGYPFTYDLNWSHNEPDILYGHVGASLWRYNVRTRTYSLAFDLASRLPAGYYFAQASLSADDDVFACTLQQSGTWAVVGYMAYRRSTNTIVYRSNDNHNEVRVDKSGRYLFVNTNDQGVGKVEVRIVDLSTGQSTGLMDDAPDHAPSHYDVGTGTAVGNGNYLVGISSRNLATPRSYTKILDLSAEGNYGGFHLSMLADNEEWALVSFYTPHLNGVMQGEVVQVATDGSGRVRRLFHHQAVVAGYYDSPRANISRDGRFIAFTSNWGVAGGRHDMFIARINPAPSSSATPTPTPTPTATPTPTPTATPTPTPTPTPLNAPALVAAARASAATLAGALSVSSAEINVLETKIEAAYAAYAREASQYPASVQIDGGLRISLYFTRASEALAAVGGAVVPSGVQNRLQITASRLAQVSNLMLPSTGGAPADFAHAPAAATNLAIIGAANTFSSASMSPVLSPISLGTIMGDAAQSPLARASVVADRSGNNPLPFELAGASVSVGGRAAPLLYVSASRISFLVPQGLAQGEFEVLVTSQDGYVSRGTVVVNAVAPALFTADGSGAGHALSMNDRGPAATSYDVNSPHALGTDKRTRVTLFATGISAGAANLYPANDVRMENGQIIVNVAESLTVEARTQDGRLYHLPVEFAGAPGGRLPGLDQVNVLLHPEMRGAGRVDLTIVINGQRSNTAAINIK
ncbi:MAG TPA: hypothetical protein VD835_18760 [Pyrinomonadaceae bacterium]|nr:hypothetical protein [Pyrinomonadaceae bacterium]